jgi:hypothetical protein
MNHHPQNESRGTRAPRFSKTVASVERHSPCHVATADDDDDVDRSTTTTTTKTTTRTATKENGRSATTRNEERVLQRSRRRRSTKGIRSRWEWSDRVMLLGDWYHHFSKVAVHVSSVVVIIKSAKSKHSSSSPRRIENDNIMNASVRQEIMTARFWQTISHSRHVSWEGGHGLERTRKTTARKFTLLRLSLMHSRRALTGRSLLAMMAVDVTSRRIGIDPRR